MERRSQEAIRRMSERELKLRGLRDERPRNLFTRWSLAAFAALVAYSWNSGEFHASQVFSQQHAANALRFLTEITPYPLHGRAFDPGIALKWALELWKAHAMEALAATLALSLAAIVAAGLAALPMSLTAARNLAGPEPFIDSPRAPGWAARTIAAVVIGLTRSVLIFVRAIPEYVWAFLFIGIWGFGPWPAVLALALHNSGILGKLGAESIENLERGAPTALRGIGAPRSSVAMAGVLPAVMPRFLLYFFYRWETCVREATVLGMLGGVSLGSLIRDARAANFYDEMIFYVMTAALLVLAGDLLSGLARGCLRRGN